MNTIMERLVSATHLDDGRSAGLGLGGGDGLSDSVQVVHVGHSLHMPPVGLVTLVHICAREGV